ncbi:MAG: flagellar filament outer layer protein FlaA [Brevinema sp.]
MKRANLQLLLAVMCFGTGLVFAQPASTNYIQRNFTLSDFGDSVDNAKSIVWKPRFSDTAVQAKDAEGENADAQAAQQDGQEPRPAMSNPDPEKNAVRYAEEVPQGVTLDNAEPQKYVLGVKAQFFVQGYNWIELSPQILNNGEEGEQAQAAPAEGGEGESTAPDPNAEAVPYRIPFTGYATDITLWAWGGQYAWWVEAYVRDYQNYQYRFNLGDLRYTGWRQKRASIPTSVVQGRKRLPASQPLTFEMIKLWSFPTEAVDMFYAYFDLLQTSTLISTDSFNGEKLANDLW